MNIFLRQYELTIEILFQIRFSNSRGRGWGEPNGEIQHFNDPHVNSSCLMCNFIHNVKDYTYTQCMILHKIYDFSQNVSFYIQCIVSHMMFNFELFFFSQGDAKNDKCQVG